MSASTDLALKSAPRLSNSDSRVHRLVRPVMQVAAMAAVYYAAARLGLMLQLPGTNASPVWPPSGIGLAAILLFGPRLLPGIAMGAFLANLHTLPQTAGGFLAAGAICTGNTLEQVVAVLLLRQVASSTNPFERVRDVFSFVVVASVSSMVASTAGTTSLWLTGNIPAALYGPVWFTWWLGDAAGMLVFAPALYCWLRGPRLDVAAARGPELAALLVLTALTAELLFGGWIISEAVTSLPYLVVPMLLWAAFRFGQRETSSLTVLISVIAIGYTWKWMDRAATPSELQLVYAPFLSPHTSASQSLFLLQLFLCAIAITSFTLGAAVQERTNAEYTLREREERLCLAQQISHIGTFEWNIVTGVNTWMPELEAMHGLPPGGFDGTQSAWEQLLYSEDRAEAIRCVERAFESGLPTEGEWRVVWPDASIRWIAGRFQVLKDESGKALKLTGVNIDITERKQAEERFRLVVEAAPNGIIMVDQAGTIVLANAQMESLFGYSKQELIGQSVEQLVPERYRAVHPQHRKAYFETPIERMMGAGRDLHAARKDGVEVLVEIGLRPIQTEAGQFVLASVIDITERKRNEERLNATLERLHGLTTHLETVREEERTRIARELHDELGQSLTGLKFELAWIKSRLAKTTQGDLTAQLSTKVEEMAALIDTTIQAMRRMVTDLRPGILDECGLAAALEWQGQEFQKRTGIRCTVAVNDKGVDRDCSSALFRIAQEALTNVARHAAATAVEIRLYPDEDGTNVNLVIDDNGRGMGNQALSAPQTFGLLGMRERAVAAGGTFQVLSGGGTGTKVMVHVPLPWIPCPHYVKATGETETYHDSNTYRG